MWPDRWLRCRSESSLRRRPGHVVVTAPFATTASRLFELAEPQLGSARIVPLSARLLGETEVARAIAGVTARGLPPPSATALATVVEEARAANRSIVLVVSDGDNVQLDRLDCVREMLGRTAAMRDVVRVVLLGSGRLLRALEDPAAKPFVDSVALHLNVQPADPRPESRESTAPAQRVAPTPRRFMNEKLLVLAVGVVLVTGVLLFPIEPTTYPERPAPAPLPVESPAEVVDSKEQSAVEVATMPALADPIAVNESRAPEPPAPAPDRRFRPPVPEGPAFQVGAFRTRSNALRLAERLTDAFAGVYIDRLGEGDASLHRVRVPIPDGPLADRRLKSALVDRGFAPVRVDG